MPYSVRGDPFDSPFALRLSKGERFAQDRTMNGITTQSLKGEGKTYHMGILKIENLTISFGGIKAVNNVSFEVEKGAVYSIIGPNGAGKTTIFNCISGIYPPNSGKIFFKGEEITYLKPHQVAKKGIARTFQNIELFSHMSTMDNLMLGRHIHMKTGVWGGATFIYKNSTAAKEEIDHRGKVEEVIDFLELQAARNQFVINLPYGTRKLVELGRALALEPEIILLDEPSAGMNLEEKKDMIFSIHDIRDDLGITVLLVEHDMNLIMDVSDRILALNFGEKIAEGLPEEIQKHPEVLKAYLGEEEKVA
jgi:branched-chain amino acid transport system ATP-binding protein